MVSIRDSITVALTLERRIQPPDWLPPRVAYEALAGSFAYGCADERSSDRDLVGFCVPPVEVLFPHVEGGVPGFTAQPAPFEQFQEHHVIGADGTEYDLTLYSLPKYLRLCADSNPNLIDVLFVPERCIRYCDEIGRHVHANRRLFLSKEVYRTYRGYSFSQLDKLRTGKAKQNPKRQALVEAHGHDTQFAYHVVRMLLECEQILTTGDLILDRDADLYRAVRNGEWTVERVQRFSVDKAEDLNNALGRCTLPEAPDRDRIGELLFECLEMQFGSLAEATRMRRPRPKNALGLSAGADPGCTAVQPEG